MKKILFSSIALLGLAGCSPGQIHANHNGGGYVYVGCHVIHTTPVDCYPAPDKCAYAFGPEGDKKVGQKIFFKQVNEYGKVGQVMTSRPCKEGE
jgi:hypothetical protein|tara:strand:+ start:368 stop:649 length:282 start_codon:yes stop_codon:yes gene_type:complete